MYFLEQEKKGIFNVKYFTWKKSIPFKNYICVVFRVSAFLLHLFLKNLKID